MGDVIDLQERYKALHEIYHEEQNKNHNLMAEILMLQERIRYLETLLHGGVTQ